MNSNGSTTRRATGTPQAVPELDASVGVVVELLGAIPKLVQRSQAQLDLVRSVAGHLPCVGRLVAGSSTARSDTTAQPVPAVDVLSVLAADPPAHVETSIPAEPEPAPVVPAPAEDELSVPDYDSLAASQVVPRLKALSLEELAVVQRYELAHRNRQTILNRVAQLLGE